MGSQGSGTDSADAEDQTSEDSPSTGGSAAEGAGAGALAGGAAGSVFGPVGTAVGAVAGGIIGAVGGILSAQDQQQLDNQKAAIAQQQAAEIQAREVANENLTNEHAYSQELAFGSSFAGSGKAGTGIGSQLEIQRQATQQNVVSNRDSQFQESMLLQQAGIDTTLGNETMTAGEIGAATSVLGGATAGVKNYTSGNSNPGLGGTQSTGFG